MYVQKIAFFPLQIGKRARSTGGEAALRETLEKDSQTLNACDLKEIKYQREVQAYISCQSLMSTRRQDSRILIRALRSLSSVQHVDIYLATTSIGAKELSASLSVMTGDEVTFLGRNSPAILIKAFIHNQCHIKSLRFVKECNWLDHFHHDPMRSE